MSRADLTSIFEEIQNISELHTAVEYLTSKKMDHYLSYQKQLDFLGTRWVFVASILAVIVAVAVTRAVSAYRTRQLFPAVDSGLTKSIYDAEPLYREGYRKFKDTPYRVTTADGKRYLAHLQTNGNQAYDGHIELIFFCCQVTT